MDGIDSAIQLLKQDRGITPPVSDPIGGAIQILQGSQPQQPPQQPQSPQQPQGLMDDPRFQGIRQGVKALNISPYELGGKIADAGYPKLGYAANVAAEAIPAVLGGEAFKALEVPAKAAGRFFMQSALKPTLDQLQKGEGQRAITTLLEKGYNPTEGGVADMSKAAGILKNKANEIIGKSSETVNKYDVHAGLQDTTKQFSKQVNPQSDLTSIENAGDQFLSHPSLTGKNTMPVQLANELKEGTQETLRKKYGQVGTADEAAQKALARQLRLEIEKKVPDVVPINRELSDLRNAIKVSQRRAMMEGNKSVVGLAPLAHGIDEAIAFLADKYSLSKSLLARALYSGAVPTASNVARVGIATKEADVEKANEK